MTVRNIPEDVHNRLRQMAKERGMSTEATVRALLEEASQPQVKLGNLVSAFARSLDTDFPEVRRSSERIEAATLQ